MLPLSPVYPLVKLWFDDKLLRHTTFLPVQPGLSSAALSTLLESPHRRLRPERCRYSVSCSFIVTKRAGYTPLLDTGPRLAPERCGDPLSIGAAACAYGDAPTLIGWEHSGYTHSVYKPRATEEARTSVQSHSYGAVCLSGVSGGKHHASAHARPAQGVANAWGLRWISPSRSITFLLLTYPAHL